MTTPKKCCECGKIVKIYTVYVNRFLEDEVIEPGENAVCDICNKVFIKKHYVYPKKVFHIDHRCYVLEICRVD